MAKTIYIGVDGFARKVKGIYVGVDGVARKVKKAYVGVNGIARLCYSAGLSINTLPPGTLIRSTIGGAIYNWMVVHQGNPSEGLYDASCNGTWLLLKDVYTTQTFSESHIRNYSLSTIHPYLNSTFFNSLDATMQRLITQVKIPYLNINLGHPDLTYIAFGSNGLSCKVFLLSAREVGQPSEGYLPFPIDGAKLSYFPLAGESVLRIAYMNGVATDWWCRTTESESAYGIITARSTYRGMMGYKTVTQLVGVRPACILSPSTLVEETPNADGSYNLIV